VILARLPRRRYTYRHETWGLRCFNPNCKRQIHYFRDGRVVRLITGTGSSQVIEHFWLCGPCFEEYDFALRDGMVFLEAKPSAERPRTDFQYAEVVLPEMERPPRPGGRGGTRREAA